MLTKFLADPSFPHKILLHKELCINLKSYICFKYTVSLIKSSSFLHAK